MTGAASCPGSSSGKRRLTNGRLHFWMGYYWAGRVLGRQCHLDSGDLMDQDYSWMLTLPQGDSFYNEWFSEHDSTTDDDYMYERGPLNEVVGVRVGGVAYRSNV